MLGDLPNISCVPIWIFVCVIINTFFLIYELPEAGVTAAVLNPENILNDTNHIVKKESIWSDWSECLVDHDSTRNRTRRCSTRNNSLCVEVKVCNYTAGKPDLSMVEINRKIGYRIKRDTKHKENKKYTSHNEESMWDKGKNSKVVKTNLDKIKSEKDVMGISGSIKKEDNEIKKSKQGKIGNVKTNYEKMKDLNIKENKQLIKKKIGEKGSIEKRIQMLSKSKPRMEKNKEMSNTTWKKPGKVRKNNQLTTSKQLIKSRSGNLGNKGKMEIYRKNGNKTNNEKQLSDGKDRKMNTTEKTGKKVGISKKLLNSKAEKNNKKGKAVKNVARGKNNKKKKKSKMRKKGKKRKKGKIKKKGKKRKKGKMKKKGRKKKKGNRKKKGRKSKKNKKSGKLKKNKKGKKKKKGQKKSKSRREKKNKGKNKRRKKNKGKTRKRNKPKRKNKKRDNVMPWGEWSECKGKKKKKFKTRVRQCNDSKEVCSDIIKDVENKNCGKKKKQKKKGPYPAWKIAGWTIFAISMFLCCCCVGCCGMMGKVGGKKGKKGGGKAGKKMMKKMKKLKPPKGMGGGGGGEDDDD